MEEVRHKKILASGKKALARRRVIWYHISRKGDKMSILKTLERNIEKHTSFMLKAEEEMKNARDYMDEMKSISRTLAAILKCEYNHSEFYDGDNPSFNLDNEEYIARLRKIHSSLAVDAKLRHIVGIIKEIIACVGDLQRKEAKLKERLKLSKENTPETIVARRRLASIREAIKGMGGRCDHLIKMFFDYRRAILNGVLGETEMLCGLFSSDISVSPVFREYYNKRIKAESFFAGQDALNMRMRKRG